MSFLVSSKTPAAILLLVLSYTVFIMGIVQIHRTKEIYHEYGGGVAALLCLGICQSIHLLGYFFASSHKFYSAMNMVIGTAFWACFNFGAIVAVTVMRNKGNNKGYCPINDTVSVDARNDCIGLYRGTEGMGWALFGWDLVFIGIVCGLVSSTRSSYSTPLGLIPLPAREDEEKVTH